jgi:hypothetical protein
VAALLLGKELLVLTGKEAVWAPELVWKWWQRELYFSLELNPVI